MKHKEWCVRAAPGMMLLILLLRFPREMTEGIRQGMTLCATAVIPSLFPFFVLCTFFVRSGLCDAVGKPLSGITKKLFRLPGTAAGAILLGMCGGYPVGTRMTSELFRSGKISKSCAGRMCLFCVAAGPAFLTGTVGSAMLKSRTAGWILFLAIMLANFCIGFFLRFTDTGETKEPAESGTKIPVVRAFCEAVTSGGSAMIPLCAWVLLFSGICSVARLLPKEVYVPVCGFLEVTNGCKAATEYGVSLSILAGILGFGGLSVHCQVFPYVLDCDVKLSQFWAFRVVSGALSVVFCEMILHFFPQAETVMMSTGAGLVKATSSTVPASVSLIFTAVIFILNTVGQLSSAQKKRI